MFQIGYDEKDLNARAELFRRCGHHVVSVPDNESAKRALAAIDKVDVFVVGHTAPEPTRKEMVDWLKSNYPSVKIVALSESMAKGVVLGKMRKDAKLKAADAHRRAAGKMNIHMGEHATHCPASPSNTPEFEL